MSGLVVASAASSEVVEVAPLWRAKTMSMPISNSRMPPAVRSAARVMPICCSKRLARPSAMTVKMPAAITVPRSAVRRRSAGL